MADTNTNGQFMGGNALQTEAAPVMPTPPGYAIPPMYPSYPVQIQGTGGYPSPGAGLISGLQAGQQLVINAQRQRIMNQWWQQQQNAETAKQIQTENLARRAQGQPPLAMPGQPGYTPDELTGAHPGIVDSVVQGAQNLVGRLFGSPTTTSPGAGPSQPQAIPSPPQSQVPQNGPNGQGSPAAMQQGGPVPSTASPASRFSGVNDSHQALPGVSGYDQGGVVSTAQDGGTGTPAVLPPAALPMPAAPIQGAGGYPSSGAGLVSGMQAGQQIAGGAVDTAHLNAQYANTQTAQQAMTDTIEGMAQKLDAAALDDNGIPKGTYGIAPPPPGTPAAGAAPTPPVPSGTPPESAAAMKAATAAAADPNAQAGVPQQSPSQSGKPHSLTPDFWDGVNNDAVQAAALAARAGQDPNQVYHSLIAMRNTFFQGEVLKNLSAANVALMNGDQKSAEKAIKNVYYYFPDGNELQTHRGPNGELQYQDPIHPTGADGKPNYVDVTAQHLQILGQAALDPMQVATTLQQYRMLPFNMSLAQLKAQGAYATGAGRQAWGQAALVKSQSDAGRVASQNYRDLSAADLDRARAASSGYALRLIQGMRLDPTAAKAANDAASAVDNLALGPSQQVPVTDAQGNPSLSPAAGHVVHDTNRADPSLSHASAQDIAQVKAWAAGLVAANPRGMTPQSAASVAAQAYRQAKTTHKGSNGKATPDVMIDSQRGAIHIWNAKARQWVNYPLTQGTALPMGSVPAGIFTMAAGGTGSAPSAAIPPQSSGGADFSNPPTWMNNDDASDSAP